MTPKHKTTDGFPVTLTVAETARILDVAPATMYAWIRHDEIPSLRLGGRVRVPTAKLADLVGVDPTDLANQLVKRKESQLDEARRRHRSSPSNARSVEPKDVTDE